jgi:hypothetical protein
MLYSENRYHFWVIVSRSFGLIMEQEK